MNLLDFDEVVFGGPAWARVVGAVHAHHRAHRRRLTRTADSRHPVRLDDSSVGEDVAAVGAACLVLDTTLSPRPSALLISR